jgi:purine/pyrimidine-nucleoside phosphorylase
MEFQNVRVVKKANVYFEGKVTSRTIYFENGVKKTLGFMLPGEYEFNTGAEEVMEILGGDMDVMVKGESEYTNYPEGKSFVVPANSSFKLIVKTYADYCCSYKEQ